LFKFGGQFSPAKGGQFAPAKGGQFNPALGGQFNRLLHNTIKSISYISIIPKKNIDKPPKITINTDIAKMIFNIFTKFPICF
jgi:hypothetical protein